MNVFLDVGHEFDRYVVEGEIGRGGMAVVYRVRHRQLGTLHALKLVCIPDIYVQWRLLQEGRVQAALRHPNIVAVHDVIDVQGAPGLLLELIEGPTLEQVRGSGMPVDQAENLFRGILAGVGFAHANGLVHRDLKPGNVLLARVGDGWLPKVTDFGLAKVLWEHTIEGDSRTRTRSNVALGTPDYMAPEQARDAANVDARADVFALGCLFYELLCGRPPFEGPDMLTVLNKVVAGDYEPIERRVPDLPQRVADAIHGCLQVDRDIRLPDCEAVCTVLDGGRPLARPLTSGPASPPDPSGKPPEPSAPTWPPPPPVARPWVSVVTGFVSVIGLCVAAVAVASLSAWLGARDPAPRILTPLPPVDAVSDDPWTTTVAAAAEPARDAVTPSRRKPREAGAVTGSAVRITGDASSVSLVDGSRRYDPGSVPPGRYDVVARFNGGEPVNAGTVTVRAGESLTLHCVAAFAQCR